MLAFMQIVLALALLWLVSVLIHIQVCTPSGTPETMSYQPNASVQTGGAKR